MARAVKTRQDWEDLGQLDPLWAILSEPEHRFNAWDADKFFASGRAEAVTMLERGTRLGLPRRREHALDVGCGVGRLTGALAEEFGAVVGVDISQTMLEEARRRHKERPHVRFLRAPADDLGMLDDDHFDLVFTKIVLQHLPSQEAILDALAEMVRVLRPGGLLVAQTTSRMSVLHHLQPKPRLYRALRTVRVPASFLYRRLRLQPIRMRAIPPALAGRRIAVAGGRVLETVVEARNAGTVWTTYWATKEGAP